MSRWKKIAGVLIIALGLAVLLPVLLIPSEACACITAPMRFEHLFGADPVDATESQLHAAMLAVLPIGSELRAIERVCATLDQRDDGPACARREGSIRGHLSLGSSPFGIHRRVMDFEFLLDGADRLAALRIEKSRWFLGSEL